MTERVLSDGAKTVLRCLISSEAPPTVHSFDPQGEIPVVVDVVLKQLAGCRFTSSSIELTDALIKAGCPIVRAGHAYSRDLVQRPPDEQWLSPSISPMVVEPISRAASNYVDVSLAAYPPDHPDAETQDSARVEFEVAELLSGSAIGPVLPASAHVVHAGRVVALLIANRMTGTAPYVGPWVSEVCRVPGKQYRGLGSILLRRAMAVLAAAGEPSLSLVVTEGNPARKTYERLGFTHADSFRKLQIPVTEATPSHR